MCESRTKLKALRNSNNMKIFQLSFIQTQSSSLLYNPQNSVMLRNLQIAENILPSSPEQLPIEWENSSVYLHCSLWARMEAGFWMKL